MNDKLTDEREKWLISTFHIGLKLVCCHALEELGDKSKVGILGRKVKVGLREN